MLYQTDITDTIQNLETQIQFNLNWLGLIDLKQGLTETFIQQKILTLLEDMKTLDTQLPSNRYRPEVNKLLAQIKSLATEPFSDQLSPFIIQQYQQTHSDTALKIQNFFNQLRLDIQISIAFSRYLSGDSDTYIQAAYALHYFNISTPLINVLIHGLTLLHQFGQSKTNKTQEYQWYLYLHELQLLKSTLITLLNIANFIVVSIPFLSPGLYFFLANICIEFAFVHLEYLKNKTRFIQEETRLIQQIRDLNAEHIKQDEQINKQLILQQLQAEMMDPQLRLYMIELLIHYQKQHINQLQHHFEFVIFALMLSHLIILQTAGLLSSSQCLLASFICAYFYNMIRPYLNYLFIELAHPEDLQVTDGFQNQLRIQYGKLSSAQSEQNTYIFQRHMLFGLISKTLIPIMVLGLVPNLSPLLALTVLCSMHLILSSIEELIKNYDQKIEKNIPKDTDTSPQLMPE